MTSFWEKIDSFRSPGEVLSFESWINAQIESGTVIKVPVGARYRGLGFEEAWF
jgi:hypothetical protein